MKSSQGLTFGPYWLEGAKGQLFRHKQLLDLSPKAISVLWELASRAGHLVSKDELLTAVWPETVVSEGVLTVCISELRHALGDNARRPRYIETVHQRGYRFIAPLTTTQPVQSLESRVQSPEQSRVQSLESGVQSLPPTTYHLPPFFVAFLWR